MPSEEDSIVLISTDHLASQLQSHTHSRGVWQNHPITRPNLKNQTRAQIHSAKINHGCQIRTDRVISIRRTASPWGPWWRNRVFRRPLSGCQDSVWAPTHHPPNPNPAGWTHRRQMWGGVMRAVTRRDWMHRKESLSWQQVAALCLSCVSPHNDKSIFSQSVKDLILMLL